MTDRENVLEVEVLTATDGKQVEGPVPLAERHPDLWWIGERFALLLDALRDMADDVVPQLEAVDTSRLSPDALAAMVALTPPRRERLRDAVALMFSSPPDEDTESDTSQSDAGEADASGAEPSVDLKEISEAETESPPTGDAQDSNEGAPGSDNKAKSAAISEALNDAFQGDLHLVGTFFTSLTAAAVSPDRVSIMRNSMLLQAISGFEVLVAGVSTRFYLSHPTALDSKDKEFSLADLQSFGSVEDAIDASIAGRVTKLMYGDLEDWAAWLKERCKADLEKSSHDWDAVRENFQRRHVIVHNGGVVSRQYLSKVPETYRDQHKLGDRLRADDAYLHQAIDELDILGASIVLAARATWSPEDIDEAAGMLLKRVYALMLRKRWVAVAKLASLHRVVKTKASITEALRANELCARSHINGPESIKQETEAWDVSASAARFELVRSVLLQDLDAAFRQIPKLVERKELSLGELHTWPILEPVRSHTGWDALAAQVGIGQDESQPAE